MTPFALNTEHVLPGNLTAVRSARALARDVLTAHYTPDLVDTVALCVSEAVTNAVQHTRSGDPGGTVTLRFYALGARTALHVDVQDDGPLKPDDRPAVCDAAADLTAERGRGLYLIHELTRYWMYVPRLDHGCLCLTFDTTEATRPTEDRHEIRR
ncbi:ATP-binding protein [Marinactinospora rubrisoli]|uniref:ATP-binding protein n=1 Tax=Marinactinospora rubrisoli TaxID=2715399 RepID=A0ABW2KMB1_9ACTN